MIIVTGGAGFIGSNLVKALNYQGRTDIIVVDDLKDGSKFVNLVDCDIVDYVHYEDFPAVLNIMTKPEVVFHQGACSDTTELDGRHMMKVNYEYSKSLQYYCEKRGTPFIYASSAAVYGAGKVFKEERQHEAPLNLYGYSKFLFDHYVRARSTRLGSQVVGLRYFNVYGPREQHKGKMASVAFQFDRQLKESGSMRLFASEHDGGDGEQCRDFVFVDDVVSVNLWAWKHPDVSGIFNVGTGRSQTFNDVANAVQRYHGRGKIQYVPFPENLKGRYQSFTEADVSRLRAVGYSEPFKTVEQAVPLYLEWLQRMETP